MGNISIVDGDYKTIHNILSLGALPCKKTKLISPHHSSVANAAISNRNFSPDMRRINIGCGIGFTDYCIFFNMHQIELLDMSMML